MRRVLRGFSSMGAQIGILTAGVTFLSAFVKNIGALGLFMPVAIQAAERANRPVSRYLMPLAFGSLIGGTITEIGTSPNILISQVRQQVTGHPYRLFDFSSIGLPLSLVAIAFLAVAWRLLPANRRGQPSGDRRFAISDYTTEARLPEDSPMAGKTAGELEALSEGAVTVSAIVRQHSHRYVPRAHWPLFAGDVLVLQGDPASLPVLLDQAKLELLNTEEIASMDRPDKEDDLETVEAVVTPSSLLLGNTAQDLHLRQRYEVNVLATARQGRQDARPVAQHRFAAGDVVALQGQTTQLSEAMDSLGLLPLAERNLSIGRRRSRYLPLLILAAALVAVGIGVLPVEAGFFLAATAIVVLRIIPVREAYAAIDWPIIIMLGCMIPVGEALQRTGAAQLLAQGLMVVAGHLPAPVAVGLIMVVSMLVTPFLHHAAAVLVMGPVAASVAKGLGLLPDPFLMAVAFGAACDFLTPIGHQNSTLVMRPAGYRFGDYWRLGLPLSLLVATAGTWLIILSWPLRAGHAG